MNIDKDIKICDEIINQYKSMVPEDGPGAFKLSQVALVMFDRLNEIRTQAHKINLQDKNTKSEVREYLRAKMKVMEHIHIQCRAMYASIERDKNLKRV